MCDHDSSRMHEAAALSSALADVFPGNRHLLNGTPQRPRGSRRTRLWELPAQAHCPVIGVCLPMSALRRLLNKVLGGAVIADEYECHVGTVAECVQRSPLSEALQRELDRRYALTLHRFAQAKTTAALAALWSGALQGADVAGALWATITHPGCDDELRDRVCRDIHMFQHQVGACNRADLQRLEDVQDQNDMLARELAAVQERSKRTLAERADQVDRLNAELMRLRALVIARDSALAAAKEELTELEAEVPDLRGRMELVRGIETQQQRMRELERDRLSWQQRAEREEKRAQTLAMELAALRSRAAQLEATADVAGDNQAELAGLRDKAILCVGGRPASVPFYRQLIECTGGKFLHHDGGEENSAAQLDASLAAADLVICQTGCVSHGAYWRVKDYCKRTGKRCLFVDKPSTSSLARCLRDLGESDTESVDTSVQEKGTHA